MIKTTNHQKRDNNILENDLQDIICFILHLISSIFLTIFSIDLTANTDPVVNADPDTDTATAVGELGQADRILAVDLNRSNSSQSAATLYDDEEVDSDISEDGGGLLSPDDESNYEIRIKPTPTSRKSVKSLFYNTYKVCWYHRGSIN